MKRSASREETFKLLYSLEIQKDNLDEQTNIFFETEEILEKDAQIYIKDLIHGIEKHNQEIKNKISKNLKQDWKIERISKINLVLLKLAIYEILYTDTPYKVVINEVVEMAKKYGEDNSPNFINGILASIVKESDNI